MAIAEATGSVDGRQSEVHINALGSPVLSISHANGIAPKSPAVVNGAQNHVEPLREASKVAQRPIKEGLETLSSQVPPVDYPQTKFELEAHGVDEVRSLRVVVIGAGLSGILAGILLPVKVPKIDLTIYEKNADVVSIPLNYSI